MKDGTTDTSRTQRDYIAIQTSDVLIFKQKQRTKHRRQQHDATR